MTTARSLRYIRRGQKIEAAQYNLLVDYIRGITRSRGGRGINLTAGINGLMVSLVGSLKDRAVWCKISDAPTLGVAVLPSNCKYYVKALDKSFTAGPLIPVYGRDIQGDECAVYPCDVGDLCIIFRNRRSGVVVPELMVLSEKKARGPC